MTFRLHHSVTLSCSIDIAWHLLSSPDELPRLQEVLPGLNGFVLSSKGDPTTPPPPGPSSLPSQEELVGLLAAPQFPKDAGLPWPDIDGSPEAAHFSFSESALVFVEGAQVAAPSRRAVFFHSRVARAGIEEWKLRVLEELDGGRVRVTEAVWGTAPLLLAWYLKLSGKAIEVHKSHMELYHTLVTDVNT